MKTKLLLVGAGGFGRVTLAGFKKFIAHPGNREKLEAQTDARKARKERECKE